jgi:predicted enzyme related to lactoylglutathione lyase
MGGKAAYKHGEFCWYELGTRDIESALKFYKEMMQWTTVSHDMGEFGVYYVFQSAGKDVGAGYRMHGPHFEGIPPHWACYVWVNDVDATATKAAALRGKVLQPPMDVPNVGRMAFLQDPQGASFAVFMGREHQGAARLSPKPGCFCWNELKTTDALAARRFYGDLLGWTFSEMPMGPGRVYTVGKIGKTNAAGILELKGQQLQGVPPHWMPHLSTADCDVAVAKAKAMGATVTLPPKNSPDGGRFAIIQDPAGALCGITTLPPT